MKYQNLKRKREKKTMEKAYQEKEEPEVICRVLPGATGNKSRQENWKKVKSKTLPVRAGWSPRT